MLRKVPLDDVKLGMFVHAMEGSWLQHPFWRRRFLLDSEYDLQRLLDSDIPGIVIDDERGAVPAPMTNAAPRPAPAPRVAAKPKPVVDRIPEEEFRRRSPLAAQIE